MATQTSDPVKSPSRETKEFQGGGLTGRVWSRESETRLKQNFDQKSRTLNLDGQPKFSLQDKLEIGNVD